MADAEADTSNGAFVRRIGTFVTPQCGYLALLVVSVLIGLVTLFTLHTVTIWLSADPQHAFHIARSFVGWYSTAWNSYRDLYNGGIFIGARSIPQFNMAAKHLVEPVVFITLDVISLIFAHEHYHGVISEDSLPFLGHYCGTTDGTIDPRTAKFCTLRSIDAWAAELGASSNADPQKAISGTNTTKLLLSTTQARRLAEFLPNDVDGSSIFPHLHLAPLAQFVELLGGLIIVVTATGADLVLHVVHTILAEIAVLLWNMVQIVIKALAQAVLALVRSGALTTILKAGMDVLMVLVLHVALPLLFAALDLFMCILGFIQPAAWAKQLDCVERTCFQESGVRCHLSTLMETVLSLPTSECVCVCGRTLERKSSRSLRASRSSPTLYRWPCRPSLIRTLDANSRRPLLVALTSPRSTGARRQPPAPQRAVNASTVKCPKCERFGCSWQ